ncbi:DUF6771 family protein [Rhizorhapis sp. SPR117]|uniref:DUF6771 family protein n=1 Tax=Rhizorhapis sp. SPR117 TaxID=2912611 RepID=UPI001F2059EA|nr:hypothetical protein [Rhizorhapis sp. SPR117]
MTFLFGYAIALFVAGSDIRRHPALLIAPETCSNPLMQRLALNPNLGPLASAIAELPEWVRLELASKNEDLRQRAEEVLVARIAAHLNQTAQYDDEQLILPLQ